MIKLLLNTKIVLGLLLSVFILGLQSCKKKKLIPPPGIVVHEYAESISFCAIGDYGVDNSNQAAVAAVIKSLDPTFIITMGDNNYPNGSSIALNKNIGKYYCDYIYNYDAPKSQRCYGLATIQGQNRFFPTLGNHDYKGPKQNIPYLNYFTLPGNEVYYDFIWGPVHFYAIDSDVNMLEQKLWFDEKLALSNEAFNIVYFHHSPYSTGTHGNDELMQWDYTGVDLVLTGHDHIYERHSPLDNSRPIYVINGLGGKEKRVCNVHPLTSNQFDTFCYDDNYGTLFINANDSILSVQFINTAGDVIDEFELEN